MENTVTLMKSLGINEITTSRQKANGTRAFEAPFKIRRKSQGGKVVTENDYETGGYVESMGPLFDKGVNMLIKAWEEWKMGPMTEPGMIEFAKKDVLEYLETQFMVENLEEAKGKDHDGDGDVDYKAVGWDGKLYESKSKKRIMIYNEESRLNYILKYILKNYFKWNNNDR